MAEQNPRNSQSVPGRFNRALSELQILHNELDARHLFTATFSENNHHDLSNLRENLTQRIECVDCALRLIEIMKPPHNADSDNSKSNALLDTSERIFEAMDEYDRQKSRGTLSRPTQRLAKLIGLLNEALQ